MSFTFVFSFLFCSSSQFVFTYHIIPQSFPILNSVIRYDVIFFASKSTFERGNKKRKVSRTKTCGCSYFLRKISFIGSQTCCPRHVFEISCNLLVCGGLSVFDKLYPHHQSHFLFFFIVASTERRDQSLRKFSLFLLLFVDGRKINLIPSLSL